MTKVMEIKDLAERTIARITSSEEEFRKFMDTASRLPMHPVQDQVLIYAQRPEAEMVFSYEDWQKKGKCHVNRGAKGIALVSENSYGGKVRYVFCDRSVTPAEGGSLPAKWRFTEEKSSEVFSRLEEKYGATEADATTAERLIGILEKECDAWLEAHISSVQRQDFGSLLKTMAIYITLRRMGINPEEGSGHYDFSALGRFNSPRALLFLDKAVGIIERPLLEEIRGGR